MHGVFSDYCGTDTKVLDYCGLTCMGCSVIVIMSTELSGQLDIDFLCSKMEPHLHGIICRATTLFI